MFGWLLLAGCTMLGQVEAPAGEDLALEVRRLVRQLDAPQLAEREAAEAAMLDLGPKILDLLPAADDRASAEVRLRLGRIRQKLQQQAAESAAQASRFSLEADALPLSKILAAFEEQTGNAIVDLRVRFGHPQTDPALPVHFDQTPFWHAFDAVLDQAGLTVYPYAEQRAVAVVGRGATQLPRCGRACYSGPLRVEAVRIAARREFRQLGVGAESLLLTLEAAWEPRLKPISLKQPMATLAATDENGNPLALDQDRGELEIPAGENATAVELILPLKLPSREVKQIASLRGTLTATVPGKVETFRFDRLVEAKNVEKRVAGATVVFEQARKNNALWEIRMRLRFDAPGDALASHRGWVFRNEAHLEGPDGKPIPYDSLETTRQTHNEVGIAYLFVLDRPPTDLTFVYTTPVAILSTQFDYELRGIELP